MNSSYLSFEEARKLVHGLGLRSTSEWNNYCENKLDNFEMKPNNIPSNPAYIYKNNGWKGMKDWLGNEYLDFEEAREFVRTLNLKDNKEWISYCKGKLINLPIKPSNIPSSPNHVYKEKWKGIKDWLGSEYLNFEEARAFVHTLGLKSAKEWNKYKKEKIPNNIPKSPNLVYKNKGWNGLKDWLGSEYLDFKEAREFVRTLNLKDKDEWELYCKGKLEYLPSKPNNIPIIPYNVYKDNGWKGIKDWLGINEYDKYLSYEEASKYIQEREINSRTKWRKFSKNERPDNIPSSPNIIYKNRGWTDWKHFFGTSYRQYEDAKKFVHTLGLKSSLDWFEFYKKNKRTLKNMPLNPNIAYKNEWKGWRDWLGNESNKYLSYEEAREFVHNLELKTSIEWRDYCKGELKEKGEKPDNIPTAPYQTYKDSGWINYGDWLGTYRNKSKNRDSIEEFWMSFEEAKRFVHTLGLKNSMEWQAYCKGELNYLAPKPNNIPSSPQYVYQDKGWNGVSDWLGNGTRKRRVKNRLPFNEAREFVHKLGLKDTSDWQNYCNGNISYVEDIPDNIPKSPAVVYKNEGWNGMRDWLGVSEEVVDNLDNELFRGIDIFTNSERNLTECIEKMKNIYYLQDKLIDKLKLLLNER